MTKHLPILLTLLFASNSSQAASYTADFEPSQGYLARQAEYLDYCAINNGPGQGGVYGQLCRLATDAGPLDETPIYTALDEINAREDTADFELNALLRMLALYGDHPALDGVRQDIIDAVLNFKYWLDEPGPDMMCWWSENHQALFHTAELVAGQLFPDTVFPNSGMTGAEHVAHAVPLTNKWLKYRGLFGFSEWHSNVYFNEDMPALINLVDLAEDQEVATRAAMVLDVMAFDMANTYFKGRFATVHGRTYPSKLIGGSSDSTGEAAWMMLNLGMYASTGNFSATFLATSPSYWPPPILEDIAADCEFYHEHKQRDGVDIAAGPDFDISYDDFEDVMFWWGMTGYVASDVIEATFDMVDYYNLWESFFWSDIAFLQPLVGSPILQPVSLHFDDLFRGPALETMGTYVYRTPDYQLSGAQDYNPGMWSAQVHIWQASLDQNAVVFTTAPGGSTDDYMAGEWTGGWMPRATFHENVGIFQYQRAHYPVADLTYFAEYTHAYFPRWAFDELEQLGHWTFGRAGQGYVALYSHAPTEWASEDADEYELIAQGTKNVWVVELGSESEWGNFQNFVTTISASSVTASQELVRYISPSQGEVQVTYTGPMTVNGVEVDIGPYERFDNPYALQSYGSNLTDISFEDQQLELDFNAPSRSYTDSP